MSLDSISELTTWNAINAFHVIARYYALSRFATLLSTRVDTEAYAIEGDRETIFDNIMSLISATNKEAMAYGYVLQVGNGSQIGDANQPVDQSGEGATWRVDALPTHWTVEDNTLARYDYGEFI